MDSERRGSGNQSLPLVSLSSKIVQRTATEDGNNVTELAGNEEIDIPAQPDSKSQTTHSVQRHVNGELDRSAGGPQRVQTTTAEQTSTTEVNANDGVDSSVAASGTTNDAAAKKLPSSSSMTLKQAAAASTTDTVEMRAPRDHDRDRDRVALSDSAASASSNTRRRSRIGHRRVDEAGTVTYKRTPTGQLMRAIQMGIQHSIVAVASKPERDILISDFRTLEIIEFPSRGSHITPPHEYNDFTFKTYAPFAFRFFRALFGIKTDQFINSLTTNPLIELSNPGASGSIFYLSPDYDFIIKTVQKKEAHFLQKLLPGYYLNLNQNPRTLLPKFYGLYCYCSLGKKIRFVVMNNLLPTVVLHEKYDLKGSTFKREASEAERAKASPTLKDLDFRRIHSTGLEFDPDSYQTLTKTLQRDCRVLESFRIMDYSLLLGIHNLDKAKQEQATGDKVRAPSSSSSAGAGYSGDKDSLCAGTSRSRASHTAAYDLVDMKRQTSVDACGDAHEQDAVDSLQIGLSRGGIPARNSNGERLLVYAGIIDILQYYRLAKRLEHAWKSVITDGDTVSVHHPSFYADRFLKFFVDGAFRKGQAQRSGPSARIRKLQCVMRLAIKKSTHATPEKLRTICCSQDHSAIPGDQTQVPVEDGNGNGNGSGNGTSTGNSSGGNDQQRSSNTNNLNATDQQTRSESAEAAVADALTKNADGDIHTSC